MAKKLTTKALEGFFLRTNKKQGLARLYYRCRRKGVNITVRTNIRVGIKAWSDAIQTAPAWYAYIASPEGARVTKLMYAVSNCLDIMFEKNEYSEESIRTALTHIFDRGDGHTAKPMSFIHSFYDFFIDGIESGLIKHHNGRRYTQRTIDIWKAFGPTLKSYSTAQQTFDDIDRLFIDGFRLFLENKGYMETTINQAVSQFRRLCRMAADYEVNNNQTSLLGWKGHKARQQEKKAEIYLTDAELDALYRMPLTGEEALTRDIFFLGYLSCQRFSDYNRLDASNFIINSEGVPVIALYQQKTGTYVEVPRTDERIEAICKRYDYNFPRLDARKTNMVLKNIFYKLSCSVPSLCEKVVTVLSLQERLAEEHYIELKAMVDAGQPLNSLDAKTYGRLDMLARRRGGMPLFERDSTGQVVRPRYELVSTHTSRRSFITNLYKSGKLDDRQIMAISGHQTMKVYEEYIKMSTAEQARRIYERMKE